MRDYKGWSVPEVLDIGNITKDNPTMPTLMCISPDGVNVNLNIPIENISRMDASEEEINSEIFNVAKNIIDVYIENAAKIITNNNKNEEITDESNTEDDLGGLTDYQISMLIKQAAEMVKIMEANWLNEKNEFKLTDSQMKLLYQYNEQHKIDMPENITDEERDNWDHFNGLNNIPINEVIKIFGADHKIISSVSEDITRQRVKEAIHDFFGWLSALREYKNIQEGYMKLIELREERDIEILKMYAEKETDPEKKAAMTHSLDQYYNKKYLGFLPTLDDKTINRLVDAYGDDKKVEYWVRRTQEKLDQLKFSKQFIYEIAQFENRFLPEKYHKVSNVFLLYFLMKTAYMNAGNKNDIDRTEVASIIFALDSIVRNKCDVELKENVLNNIQRFLDQFIDPIVNKYGDRTKKEE